MKYIDKGDILELIKKISKSSNPEKDANYEMLSKYQYGQLTVRDFDNRSVAYDMNIITNGILKQKWDETLISSLENLNLISANRSGMHYYQVMDDRYMGFADVFAFALNNAEKLKLDKNTTTYLNGKLRDKEFYSTPTKDGNKLYGFKNDDIKKDTPYLALYGIRNNNPYVLNFLYQDIIKNKDKYISLVASQVKFANFKNMIEHFEQKNIDWENYKDIKISSVSKIFMSSNFLLNLAKSSNLSNAQKDIIDYIFEKEPKLMKKIMSSAGLKGIYEKPKEKQQESKDLFLVALHNNNYAFIEALLKNGYVLNSKEKAIGDVNGLYNKVESIKKSETSEIVKINNKINDMILNGSTSDIIEFVKELSQKDLEVLKEFQDEFSYTAVLVNKMDNKSDSERHTHLIKLSSNKDLTPFEVLICKESEILLTLKNKGFDGFHKEVAKYAMKHFFNNLYFNGKVNYEDQIVIIKHAYSNLSDNENLLLTHEILKGKPGSAYEVMIAADKAINCMLKEGVMKITEENRPLYASRLISLYSAYSVEEKRELYGKDKEEIDNLFISKYIDAITNKMTDKDEKLIEDILLLTEKEETLQQKAIQRLNKRNSDWNDLSTVIAHIERKLLMKNTNQISSSPVLKSRL